MWAVWSVVTLGNDLGLLFAFFYSSSIYIPSISEIPEIGLRLLDLVRSCSYAEVQMGHEEGVAGRVARSPMFKILIQEALSIIQQRSRSHSTRFSNTD